MKLTITATADASRIEARNGDGNPVARGQEAEDAFHAHLDEVNEQNNRVLDSMTPRQRETVARYLRERRMGTNGSLETPEAFMRRTAPPLRRAPNGRAPREARNERHRGSRRGERATSSSSDDPDPPPAARPCACGCGQPRRPADYYSSDECRKRHARERKREQRTRDRESTERHVERRLGTGEELPQARSCRCGSHAAYAIDHGWICVACGRTRPSRKPAPKTVES